MLNNFLLMIGVSAAVRRLMTHSLDCNGNSNVLNTHEAKYRLTPACFGIPDTEGSAANYDVKTGKFGVCVCV